MGYFKVDPRKILKKKGITTDSRQNEIIKSVEENRVTVCVATRRGGKSEIAGACATAVQMIPDKYIGLTAPFMIHTDIVFGNAVDNLTETLEQKPKKLNNKDRRLETYWGSTLRATTLKNRKSIAGRPYDLFIGDEVGLADYMTNDNWLFQEVLPATITTKGHVLVISTPRGLNHLHDLWEKAEKEADWNRIRYTIHDVEHIDKKEIENMERLYREQGMEKLWAQEFLAEFISFEGSIFDFQPQIVENTPDPELLLVGVDPGMHTAIVKLNVNKHGVFVEFVSETEASTADHGKKLQELTMNTDLNVCDSAARQFIVDMAYEFEVGLTKANKAVDEGINFLRRLKGHLYVKSTCDDVFIKQWSNYAMKNDKIVKKFDHTIDAVRYALYTAYTFWPEYFEPFLEKESVLWEY